MKMKNGKIDLILPWVDSNDYAWKKEITKYRNIDQRCNRYQSWDNLQYVFRGIEKCMPWVNKVFFVTWGHFPDWLKTDYDRIRIVRHEEYIPEEYLPTFNSNTIEMNYWRIQELSENFVLFNDDLFPLRFISEEYYFKDGKPCEEAVETHFILKAKKGLDLQMNYACVNNMVILNRHFDKRKVVEENRDKWFSPVYGERLKQNENLAFWNNFESFVYPHEAMPMRKSVLKEIWDNEPEMLDIASRNRFRAYSDVTQRLITMWQICSGDFVPAKYQGKLYIIDHTNYREAADDIRNQRYPIISLNESVTEGFDVIKGEINTALQEILPDKSAFEK